MENQLTKEVYRTAVILCGGKGTRLGLLGKKTPKTLVKIQGRPIIWFIIKMLKKNNFNHFIIPIGYKGNLIKEYLKKNFDNKKYNIDIVNTGIDTDIALRINKIFKLIKSDNFLLLNGDAIFDFNIDKTFELHKKNKYDTTFLSCEINSHFGTIGVRNNKIIDFQRNASYNSINNKGFKNYKGYIYSGMSILSKRVFQFNYKNFKNFELKIFPILIKEP